MVCVPRDISINVSESNELIPPEAFFSFLLNIPFFLQINNHNVHLLCLFLRIICGLSYLAFCPNPEVRGSKPRSATVYVKVMSHTYWHDELATFYALELSLDPQKGVSRGTFIKNVDLLQMKAKLHFTHFYIQWE